MLHGTLTNLPSVIAHRGARNLSPENTLSAMRKAKELGATWVEFDVMLTADGEAIVIHDTEVNRTTNGKGDVGKMSYAEICALDAGSWFANEFCGEKIPRLVDMINCLGELGLGANIEIKPYPNQDRETAITTLQIVKQHWPESLPPPLLSSFSLESLRTLRQHDHRILLGLLLDKWNENWEKLADELQCATVHLNHRIATPQRIEAIKNSGRFVLCYTVNSVARAKKLTAWGVDSVFSDCVDKLLNYFN